MLILLPPSEGKAEPRRGAPLDLGSLSFPVLTDARRVVLDALVSAGEEDPDGLAAALGVGPTQRHLVDLDARLRSAPTARADGVYSGVLYDALGLASLSAAGRRRAARRLAITSALFGLLRPGDRIPAYRLSGDTRLPGLGPVAATWRDHLGAAVLEAVGSGLLVDLRSTSYAALWRPPAALAARTVTVRVLHESDGVRKVVSHFNKATKGRLVRTLLEDERDARSPGRLADQLVDHGWSIERAPASSRGTTLDVVVGEV